jgi:hypothetical protein
MSAIAAADLHMNKLARDEHRWGLFAWLRKMLKEAGADELLLLGDITDAKDHHGAELVNRLADELTITAAIRPVTVLTGNHDGHNLHRPFFGFMRHVPNVKFITDPTQLMLSIGPCLFLPATDDYERDWGSLKPSFNDVKWIFTHTSFDGCISENGTRMTGGVPPSFFKGFKGRIISGDIHQPQKMNYNIEYIGAPYHVRFGDAYKPRVLHLHSDGSQEALHFETKRKYVFEVTSEKQLEKMVNASKASAGDQVDVRVHLTRAGLQDWAKTRIRIKEALERRGLEVFGPKPFKLADKSTTASKQPVNAPIDALEEFIAAKKLPVLVAETGRVLLRVDDEA